MGMGVRGIVGAVAGLMALAGGGAAAQLSNGLEAPAQEDLSALVDMGFVPYDPNATTRALITSGFGVEDGGLSPDGTQRFFLVKSRNGIPFVFKYSRCGQQGCMFLEAIAPVPNALMRKALTGGEVNDFNRFNPVMMLTVEDNGSFALRSKQPALRNCDLSCQQSGLMIFFNGVNFSYQKFLERSRQVEVSYQPSARSLAPSIGPSLASLASEVEFSLADPGAALLGAKAFFDGQAGVKLSDDGFPALLAPK